MRTKFENGPRFYLCLHVSTQKSFHEKKNNNNQASVVNTDNDNA